MNLPIWPQVCLEIWAGMWRTRCKVLSMPHIKESTLDAIMKRFRDFVDGRLPDLGNARPPQPVIALCIAVHERDEQLRFMTPWNLASTFSSDNHGCLNIVQYGGESRECEKIKALFLACVRAGWLSLKHVDLKRAPPSVPHRWHASMGKNLAMRASGEVD